jgi:hypothetical protein
LARKKILEEREVVSTEIEREVREAFILSKLKSSALSEGGSEDPSPNYQ